MKLNSKLRLFLSCSASFSLITTAASAAEIKKDAVANTNNLNTAAAWVGPNAPGSTDVALWDSTVTASNASDSQTLTQLGGDVSWQGIKVTDVGGTRNVSGSSNSHVRILNTDSANTLTLGSAGIDMSSAMQALLINSKITLAADQEWNIANASSGSPFAFNNGEDLALQALVANTAFNLGGHTLTLKGVGNITITSGYTISNGTINVQNNSIIQGGNTRATSLSDTAIVNITNGVSLRLQNNSNSAFTNAAAISVSGAGSTLNFSFGNANSSSSSSGDIAMATGTTLSITSGAASAFTQSGGIDFTGSVNWDYSGSAAHADGAVVSGDLTGDGSVNFRNTNSATNGQVRLSGDNSGFTGTMTLNGASGNRALRLMNATAGSAAATWDVTTNNILQVDGVSVQLGTLNGAGTVTNSHASNAATLNVGAGAFSGVISDGATATTSLVKNTADTLTLSGTNTYTGATTVSEGTLVINGAVASTTVVVNGSLAGSSVMANATLSGSGSINPGNSPGVMTVAATDPTGGLAYNFEFTAEGTLPAWDEPTASINDVLRLTSASPFTSPLDSANFINIYFDLASIADGDVFTGGFYTDSNADFLSAISNATFQYFLADASGSITYNGGTYNPFNSLAFDVATISKTADFGSGDVTGYVTQFTAVPEPAAALLGGLGALMLLRRRR